MRRGYMEFRPAMGRKEGGSPMSAFDVTPFLLAQRLRVPRRTEALFPEKNLA